MIIDITIALAIIGVALYGICISENIIKSIICFNIVQAAIILLFIQIAGDTGSDIPIVMLSSVTDQTLVKKCQELGISGFIFKPIQASSGAEIIVQYLKIA